MKYTECINEIRSTGLMRLRTGIGSFFLQLKNLPESPIKEKERRVELVSKGLTRSLKNISHCDSYYRLHRTGFTSSTVIFFLSILFSFVACQKNIPPPQHLIGIWKTSAPQYENRYLKITEDSLTYGIGKGEEVSHTIEKMNVKQGNGETIYIFHYKDREGEKCNLTLIYSPLSGGTIRLKNKNDIWEKVGSESPE